MVKVAIDSTQLKIHTFRWKIMLSKIYNRQWFHFTSRSVKGEGGYESDLEKYC